MISTISPVPSTVAPEMPDTRASCGPMFFTDDFLVADHFVDVDRGVALAAAQQQHGVVALRLRLVLRVAQRAAAGSGTDSCVPATRPCARRRSRPALRALICCTCSTIGAGSAHSLSAGAHEHRLRHRERERQVKE